MSYPPQPGYGGGYPPPGGFAPPAAQQTNGIAIAALVTGILSLACFPAFALAAIPLGLVGLSRANAQNGNGKGLAIGGIITGVLGLILGVVLVFVFVIAADSVDNDFDRINSDPSDGVCNEDRFLEDPDC